MFILKIILRRFFLFIFQFLSYYAKYFPCTSMVFTFLLLRVFNEIICCSTWFWCFSSHFENLHEVRLSQYLCSYFLVLYLLLSWLVSNAASTKPCLYILNFFSWCFYYWHIAFWLRNSFSPYILGIFHLKNMLQLKYVLINDMKCGSGFIFFDNT